MPRKPQLSRAIERLEAQVRVTLRSASEELEYDMDEAVDEFENHMRDAALKQDQRDVFTGAVSVLRQRLQDAVGRG